jgi:ABC-type phosphate/phosphonate transport system substrate-binding protein
MALICAYPMYQMPELERCIDAWWQGVYRHLIKQDSNLNLVITLPKRLTQPKNYYAHWRDDQLLLSQTCGFPLTHDLLGQVQYVATQSYQTPFNHGPTYTSVVLVRNTDTVLHIKDLFQTRIAVNSDDSQSGYHALRGLIAPLAQGKAFFSEVVRSLSHRKSMALVVEGRADACAVDCVTYSLLQAHAPLEIANLRILATTPSAPCLPYITSLLTPPEVLAKLQLGLISAALDPTLQSVRNQLLMGPVSILTGPKPYQEIVRQASKADALGYKALI